MSDSQKWMLLIGFAGAAWLVYLLAPVMTPFLIAFAIAYLGDPVVDRLERSKLSRTAAVSLVFVAFFLLFAAVALLLVPLIERQVAYLLEKLPDYLAWVQATAVPWVGERLGLAEVDVDLERMQQVLQEDWQKAGGLAAQVLHSVSASGLALLAWLANLVLVPVVTFYLLRDWDRFMANIDALLPRRAQPTVARFARESDEVLSAFLRGQLLVMLALGVIYSVGLWIVGLKLALLIGILAGLVSFVPYLGFIVGLLVAGVAVIVQTHELMMLLPVLVVFGIGQLAEGMFLTPWLVGDRIGLHPVAVIFAVLAGGQLFGFFGVLLALPAAAVIAVALRHAHGHYVQSGLYEHRN